MSTKSFSMSKEIIGRESFSRTSDGNLEQWRGHLYIPAIFNSVQNYYQGREHFVSVTAFGRLSKRSYRIKARTWRVIRQIPIGHKGRPVYNKSSRSTIRAWPLCSQSAHHSLQREQEVAKCESLRASKLFWW